VNGIFRLSGAGKRDPIIEEWLNKTDALTAVARRCQEAGVTPSIGSVGDAYDNAMAESFFATLERELLSRRRFRSQAEAKMAVFEWLEGWYNRHRRHSSLGYRSPANYEQAHQRSRNRIKNPAIGIGGAVTRTPPLPHHRTCGSRIRRFGGLSREDQSTGLQMLYENAAPAARRQHTMQPSGDYRGLSGWG